MDEPLYSRDIHKKILSLRILLLTYLVGLTLFAVIYRNDNILLAVFALFCVTSLVKVYDFERDSVHFSLVTYYFFGLVRISAIFSKKGIIKIDPVITKKSEESSLNSFDAASETAAVGCLAAPILSSYFDAGQSNTIAYKITYSRQGKPAKKKKFNLYWNEYKMIEKSLSVK